MKVAAQTFNKKVNRGFTLIELLVVIAVIGVLAGAIIVAINPTEQLARGRDAGRKSTQSQLASAVNGYFVAKGGVLPTANVSWITSLTTSGDLKVVPTTPNAPLCTTSGNSFAQNGYCYIMTGGATGTDFAVFVQLESAADKNKCGGGTNNAYYLYSSLDAKSGVVCGTGAGGTTQPNAVSGYTYL